MKMIDESVLKLNPGDQEILKGILEKKDLLIEQIEKIKQELQDVDKDIYELEENDESKASTRAKKLGIGRKRFNMDPKKGIEYLVENEILVRNEREIAKFLYKGEGLNKTAMGDYLGEKSEFHLSVLHEFVALHEFTNLNLDKALRQFLWSFRLPGEAQKIDRMMEAFAHRYCECNPNVFSNTDTCYVLSFAIIMLNTSLHNPSVKEKPSAERFISMNRGINDGKDLPNQLLIDLYDSIKKEPFKIPEDDDESNLTFFNPDKEGWLLKQGGRYKTWKRRWFLLTDNCLYYFELTADREPKGIIPLENLQIREVTDQKKPHCFELYAAQGTTQTIKAAKTDSDGRLTQGKHTIYRMSAGSKDAKDEWISCIRKSVSKDPYYDMIAARKRKAVQKHSGN